MSTLQENLDRIKNAKSAIKNAIIQKGIDVTDTEKIETYADKILQIKSGGGTTEIPEFDPDGPLTFYRLDDIGDSYVSLGPNALSNIEYSTDKTTWKTYTSKQKIKLGKGEYVQFKCNRAEPTSNDNKFYTVGGLYNLYGKDTSIKSLNKDKTFKRVFSCLNIVDASNFTLDCDYSGSIVNKYQSSFSYCILLTELPKLSKNNYSSFAYMFQGCTSLKRIPNNYLQNSSKLYDNCYSHMFDGCTGLTTLPSGLLPATTLASSCYNSMFYGCTSLTTIPNLPATTLASSCYQYMFNGCTGLVETPGGWILKAQTTATYSCYAMFYGCSKLQKIAVSYSGIITASHWSSFLYNVSKTGTFYYSKNQTKENIKSIVPSGWTLVQSKEW